MHAAHVAAGARPSGRAPLRRARSEFLTGVVLALTLLPLALVALVLAGQVRLAAVTSGSMGPAVPVGALVVGRQVPAEAVRVGDIVTFTAPTGGRPSVTHRAVGVAGTATDPVVQTKGDANASGDPWLLDSRSGPVWRAEVVVPRAGAVLASPGRLVVLALTTLLPTLLVVAFLRLLWRPPARAAA